MHPPIDIPTAHVARLWRYPVKSMLGQPAEALDLYPGGIAGDRVHAVRDASGRPASGKKMDGHAHIPNLLDFSAGYSGEIVEIHFPDGSHHRTDDPDIDAALSDALGQPVLLTRERDSAHVDYGALHLLTTASLTWLHEVLPAAAIDERRFRPNLVLDAPGDGPIEQDWIGQRLTIGEVELRITEPTERCGMVSMAHAELPRDPRVLRSITTNANMNFGVYADILHPGRITTGAPVQQPA